MITVISVVGARPNFMKVAPLHRAFQGRSDRFVHQLVHTGQHYDAAMSDAFFADLDMPHPAHFLGVGSGSHAEQTARVMLGFEKVCLEVQPNYVIVVGDVNSTIACALTSVKLGIRTAHVEAGLRSGDRTMPEEINRKATDAIVDDHFVTEPSGVHHLEREGIHPEQIHLVGNTMIDSLHYALPKAESSAIHASLGVQKGHYVVATLHRPSNVDNPGRLAMLLSVMETIAQNVPVVFPMHPRTRRVMEQANITPGKNVIVIDPVGYVDFLALLKHATFALTDSGGIQEETTALGVPCITARTTTERPITVEIGTNVLVQPEADAILSAAMNVLSGNVRTGRVPDLWDGQAAPRIISIIDSLHA